MHFAKKTKSIILLSVVINAEPKEVPFLLPQINEYQLVIIHKEMERRRNGGEMISTFEMFLILFQVEIFNISNLLSGLHGSFIS